MPEIAYTETYTSDYHRVECPFCGHKNDLSEGIGQYGEGFAEAYCGECDTPFSVGVYISYRITVGNIATELYL